MSSSPIVGGIGGVPYTFSCPPGAYISQIEGRSGSLIDRISARCSDGTQSAMYGGTGGTAWTDSSPSGFIGATNMRGNIYAARLQMLTADGNVFPAHGGTGGNAVGWTGCPPGEKIMMISGGAKTVVDSFKFTCGKIADMITPDTAQPSGNQIPPGGNIIVQPLPAQQLPAQPLPNGGFTPQPAGMSMSVILFLFFLIFVAVIATYFALRQSPRQPPM